MWHNTFGTEQLGCRSRYFYEPLNANAPHDETCKIWCCYINTIIFYKQPWTWAPDGKNFAEWDRIETQWDNLGKRFTDEGWGWQSLAPFVIHDGRLYELSTGEVIWRNDHWYMRWIGWLIDENDRRWPFIKDKPGEK